MEMKLNKNTKFLLDKHYEDKNYDTIPLSINTTKSVENYAIMIANEQNIDFDDAVSLLILKGAEHIYDE